MKNNQKNDSIYNSYQTNNQSLNKQVNEPYRTENVTVGKRISRVVMMISLVAIIVLVGGFALVYTGVIKVGQIGPQSILLNASNIGVRKGKDYQYDYQVYPETSTAKNVYYESSDPSVAEVNRVTGYVTPIKEGTTTISVKSTDDDTVIEKSNLSVTNEKVAINDIKLSSERIVFDLSNKSKSQLLKVFTEPYNATNQELSFESSDTSVAIVDQSGRVYPVGFGMANIVVRTKDGNASATCEVIVTDSKNKKVYFELPDKGKIVFPYSIELDTTYLKLKYGTSRKVGFILLPPDVTEDVVTWISSDPTVATVKEGLVEGVAIGHTTITARTVNDLVATLDVDVTDEEVISEHVSFAEDKGEIEVGESERLGITYDSAATVNKFEWSSSNPDIVSVDSEGTITALGRGSAVITVKPLNNDSESDMYYVTSTGEDLPTSISVSSETIELGTGESREIEVEGDTGNTNFNYESSNSEVVKVNENGILYGVAPGNATITITTANGTSAQVNVIVSDVEALRVVIDDIKGNAIKVGDTAELTAEVFPNNTTDKNLTWTSSNEKVLTVNNGVIKGISVGTAKVRASVNDTTYGELEINVISKSATIPETSKNDQEVTDAEKDKIKKISAKFEKQDDTELLMSLQVEEAGFADDIVASKTEFKIDKTSLPASIKNLKLSTGKKLAATSKYVTFDKGSYGTFTIKVTVTLKNGEKIELDDIKYTIDTSISSYINLNTGDNTIIYVNFGSKYQDDASKVTNWISSDTNIAEVQDDLVVANSVGDAKLTGSYDGANFTLNVTVKAQEEEKITVKHDNYSFQYGTCYSICPGGVISNSNLTKSEGKCSSEDQYFISKENYSYHYTCTTGNRVDVYTGKSTYSSIGEKLKFNYAAETLIKKGQKITVKIQNWDKLNLKSAKVSNTLSNSTSTIKDGKFSITVPADTSSTSFNITVEATSTKNKHYKDVLPLRISENPLIGDIKCGTDGKNKLSIAALERDNLNCVMIDKNNNSSILASDLKEEVTYKSSKESIVIVDYNGKVTALKEGKATITVTTPDMSKKVAVTVTKAAAVYKTLKLTLNKNNKSKNNEIELGDESAYISYTASTSNNKNKVTSGLAINYVIENPEILELNGNRIIPKQPGTTKIKATYTNVKKEEITAEISISIVEKDTLSANITKVDCLATLVYMGDPKAVNCQMWDATNKKSIPIKNATYKIDNKNIISIENDIIKPLKVGSTTVKATVNGKSDTFKVTVKATPPTLQSIEIIDDNGNVVKETDLVATGFYDVKYRVIDVNGNVIPQEDAPGLVLTTKNTKTKIVNIDGLKIMGASKGKATITATYTNPTNGEKKDTSFIVNVYENLTCYRYYEAKKEPDYPACEDGYGYLNSKSRCAKIITSATTKQACLGITSTNAKWYNGLCLDANDWKINKKTTVYKSTYSYTKSLETAQKGKFDTALYCRNSCSKDACADGTPTSYSVSVTFNSDGGSEVMKQFVEAGKNAFKPEDPTKNGKVFVEWQLNGKTYDFNTPVTSNITLKAVWRDARKFTVKFVLDDGTVWDTQTVTEGNTVNIPSKVPYDDDDDNVSFNAWVLDGKEFDFSTIITSDITLKADWSETAKITLRLDTNLSYLITVEIGTKLSDALARPEHIEMIEKTAQENNWTLKGWKLNGEVIDPETTSVKENLYLEAVWETNE